MRLPPLIALAVGLFAANRTAERERLDARLADQRAALAEERRLSAALRRDAEIRIKAARRERQRLTIQRIYHALQTELAAARCGQFDLVSLIGADGVNRFAARVTSVAAREIQRDD